MKDKDWGNTVAQLVEPPSHRTRDPDSIPTSHTVPVEFEYGLRYHIDFLQMLWFTPTPQTCVR